MRAFILAAFVLGNLQLFSQAGSEIILYEMKVEGGQVSISNPVNITNRKGYDNQPFFHPKKSLIYYSSFDDSARSDIRIYDIEKKTTTNLTRTREREYSPTVTPDLKFVSCIVQRDNGAQDLGKYPVNGGVPVILIDDLKVGYHSWVSDHELLLFVLGDINTIQFYDLDKKTSQVIANNVGRSLHKIPGEQAMSFIQKTADSIFLVQKFDIATKQVSTIGKTFANKEDITWLNNRTYLMSDGQILYSFDINKQEWNKVMGDRPSIELGGITRLTTNSNNTRLAVVFAEVIKNSP